MVLALLAGYAAGAARVFQARAAVYVPASAGFADLVTLSAFAHADSLLAPIARQVHLPLAQLEANLAVSPVGGIGAAGTGASQPLLQLTIRAPKRTAALHAVRLLAATLSAFANRYRLDQTKEILSQLHQLENQARQLAARALLASHLQGNRAIKQTALGLIQDASTQITRQHTDLRLKLTELAETGQSKLLTSSARPYSPRTRLSSALIAATIALIATLTLALTLPTHNRRSRQ